MSARWASSQTGRDSAMATGIKRRMKSKMVCSHRPLQQIRRSVLYYKLCLECHQQACVGFIGKAIEHYNCGNLHHLVVVSRLIGDIIGRVAQMSRQKACRELIARSLRIGIFEPTFETHRGSKDQHCKHIDFLCQWTKILGTRVDNIFMSNFAHLQHHDRPWSSKGFWGSGRERA